MGEIGSSERPDWPTAVIVGAGGMGMAVARRIGMSHRLLVADRDGYHVERKCSELNESGYDAQPVTCDVTRPTDITGLSELAAARPALRTLVNVVGLAPAAKDFDAIMAVNLIGASRVANAFEKILEAGGAGIFISSSAAHMQPIPDNLLHLLDDPLHRDFIVKLKTMLAEDADANRAYALSKAGLNRMCQHKAASWGKRGLRIVSLSPGLVASPQGAKSYRNSSGKKALFEALPLGRECTMLEIANIVAFLASDQASYITGTDILVDGGLIAALNSQKQ